MITAHLSKTGFTKYMRARFLIGTETIKSSKMMAVDSVENFRIVHEV